MPTKSIEYNSVFAKWQKTDPDVMPECEECGADLTGKDVFCGKYGWYCMDCDGHEIEISIAYSGLSDYEERMWERKQMGILL